MKKKLQFLIGVVAAMTAGVAGATQWFSQYATTATAPNEYKITVGTETVYVRAYSTTNAADPMAGKFSASAVAHDSDTFGFGVNNMQGGDPGEGAHPEITLDNTGLYDILVFEMPTSNFSLDALKLGFADGDSDISVFWGGNNLGSGYDFTKACFTGCTNSGSGSSAYGALTSTNLGFQQINMNDVAVGSAVDPGFSNPGRYLVVAGSLTDTTPDDKVKVNMITGHKVPAPGTLALLGLSLVGMGALKRRNAA